MYLLSSCSCGRWEKDAANALAMFQSRRFYPFGPTVANSHPSTKKKEDDVVLLLYVVSLSTDVAPLEALRCG